MRIHMFERFFLAVSAILVVLGAVAVGISFWTMGVRLPGPVARLDPRTTLQTAPFNAPGLTKTGESQYEAVLTAESLVLGRHSRKRGSRSPPARP